MNLSFRSHLKCGVAFTVAMSLLGAASSAQAQETDWSGLYTGVAIGLGQLNATNDIQELCSYDGYDCPKQEMNAHGTAVSLYTGFMMNDALQRRNISASSMAICCISFGSEMMVASPTPTVGTLGDSISVIATG